MSEKTKEEYLDLLRAVATDLHRTSLRYAVLLMITFIIGNVNKVDILNLYCIIKLSYKRRAVKR